MASTIQVSLPPMEVKAVAPATAAPDKMVVLKQRLLRDAIDESGWKHDAVACAIGVDGPYLSKMLSTEKPITFRHLDAMPGDIEARFSQKYAERCGLIVVVPAVGEDAIRQFVAGLFGLMRRSLA